MFHFLADPKRADTCFPVCGPGGSCLPSHRRTNETLASSVGKCACAPGFTGNTCKECLPGHYGTRCLPCPSQCFGPEGGQGRCDDGVEGSGGCLGSFGNSTAGESCIVFFFSILKNTPSHRIVSFLVACNCLFGTCTSDKSCECSAGWINDSNSSLKCSVCAPGFYASEDGNECHGKKPNSITKRCLAWIAHTEFEFSQPVLLVP